MAGGTRVAWRAYQIQGRAYKPSNQKTYVREGNYKINAYCVDTPGYR